MSWIPTEPKPSAKPSPGYKWKWDGEKWVEVTSAFNWPKGAKVKGFKENAGEPPKMQNFEDMPKPKKLLDNVQKSIDNNREEEPQPDENGLTITISNMMKKRMKKKGNIL